MASTKPIIVSGAHRSGSTWIGKTIGAGQGIRYVHEPFNIQMKVHACPFPYWFQHISDRSTHKEIQEAKRYLTPFFRYSPSRVFQIWATRNPLRKKGRQTLTEFSKIGTRALIKDPIAIMSLPWLHKSYKAKVVISVRHPAAFIASIKVKNWTYDFSNYTQQSHLMDSYLKDFREAIESARTQQLDIIDQGILLWNTLYHTVAQYQQEFPNWYYVTHEALSKEPKSEFETLFKYLDIPFSKKVQDTLLKSTQAEVASEWSRDSVKNIKTWKDRLTKDEIDRIKQGTASVWPHFYTEESWH